MMRLSITILTATLLTGSLVDCSNGYGVPQAPSISADGSASKTSVAPVELRSSETLAEIHAAAGLGRPDVVTPGIYASEYSGYVYGYAGNNRSNSPPVCSIGPAAASYDVAVDRKGDVLFVDRTAQNTSRIIIYAGPGLCGPELGSIADPYGLIVDVASRDAQTGKIVVANYLGNNLANGNVAVCTLSGGCTRHLSLGLGLGKVYGVAVAPNGDCWASGESVGGQPPFAMVYFAHCMGKGVFATGFGVDRHGGIDIDANGNFVVIDASGLPDLTVYSGCNPTCAKLMRFVLKGGGGTLYGHLDANSDMYIAAEGHVGHAKLDVYSYSPTALTYLYSITNGLTLEDQASAFSPNSKE
jgi:hypothetical protein